MQHRLPGWPQTSAGLWKKTVTENFTSDPSSNAMNYVKFTVVMAAAVALKQCLEYRVSSPKRLMAFIGGNYLARVLSDDDPKDSPKLKGQDKVLETY